MYHQNQITVKSKRQSNLGIILIDSVWFERSNRNLEFYFLSREEIYLDPDPEKTHGFGSEQYLFKAGPAHHIPLAWQDYSD